MREPESSRDEIRKSDLIKYTPVVLGPSRCGLLREHEAPDGRVPPTLLGLLGAEGGYINGGLTESSRFALARFRQEN